MGKEKKEIGKLLELLNEYDGEDKGSLTDWKESMINQPGMLRLLVISKQFGFIQQLVEKNKINISKSGIDELPAMYAYDYDSIECKTDRLLMLLAIQDNPIDFLLSILK